VACFDLASGLIRPVPVGGYWPLSIRRSRSGPFLILGVVPFRSAVRRGSQTLWSFGLPKKQYRHCPGNFDLSPNYRGSGTGVNIIANRCTLFDRLLTDPKRQNKKCQNEYCYIWNEISTHGESSVRAGNSQRQSHEGPPQLAASFISSRASLIPCQLPSSPMRVFPVGIEHALDVPVQRSRPILRELKDPAAPRRGQVREKAAQDRPRAARWIMP
jgi:hypothetical protein